MAIDLNKQSIIKKMLESQQEWTSADLQFNLAVTASWVSKNAAELKLYGIKIVRKEHKEHSNKGLAKSAANRVDYTKLKFNKDYHLDNWIQIRFLVNQFHMKLSIPVPFAIENDERVGDTISHTDYKVLEDNYNVWSKDKSLDDIYTFLKDLKEEILASDQTYNKASAKRIFIHMFNIIESYPYISLVENDPVLLLQVKSGFKDVHNFEPTSEQVQVIAKAYKFATGAYAKHKVASIQSDAGSSKTTCALVIQHLLFEQIPYITAITNKALNNIKNSKTVASLLNTYADIEVGDSYKIKLIKAKANACVLPFIIVDESSQCGMKTRTLLETLSDKVLYMGDQEQLPAIMDDQGVDFLYLHTLAKQYRFFDAEDTFQIEYSQLNKHKLYNRADTLLQSKIVGTIKATSKFRTTEEASSGFEKYSDFSDSFSNYESLLKAYSSNDHLIITYAQGAVDAINNIVNEGEVIKLNSKVMLITNHYTVEQFNGFIYRVIDIADSRALCQSIDTGNSYWYKIKDLVLAYAVTTMKIQGSQVKYVLGIIDTMKSLSNLDRYVITTRASHTVRFIQCTNAYKGEELVIQTSAPVITIQHVLDRLKGTFEGSRNNMLYGCAKDLCNLDGTEQDFIQLATVAKSIGLRDTEIKDTIHSARTIPTTISVKEKAHTKPIDTLNLNSMDDLKNPRTELYFTPVFKNHKTLIGKEQTLTHEQALAYPNIAYVAEQLKGSNRVVIDCDSIETVSRFSQYINKTESYLSEDKSSLHLVFTTNKVIPTKHFPSVDLLGNKLFQIRSIKDNKTPNNLTPIQITQDVLDLLSM